jgi:hypothetical protein
VRRALHGDPAMGDNGTTVEAAVDLSTLQTV